MKGLLKRIWPFALLFATAGFLRFYNIGHPFSVNGIDEGVHLMAAKLGASGFTMYSQINTLQGPFFLYIYSLLDGNVVACRSLSGLFSLFGILGICLISYRLGGRSVALFSGAFLAFSFYFLKEGRLASMDLFASVLLIWGFYPLVLFMEKEDHANMNLVFSGCLFAMASMTKLYAAIPTIGVSVYLFTLWLRGQRGPEGGRRTRFTHLLIFGSALLVVVLSIMSIYGMGNTFTGSFTNNLHKLEQPYWQKVMAFSVLIGLLPIPFIFGLVHAMKRFRKREVQLLLIWIVLLLGLYMTLAVTWIHHYTIIVPPLCILGSLGLHEFVQRGRDSTGVVSDARDLDRSQSRKYKIHSSLAPNAMSRCRGGGVAYVLGMLFITGLVISNFVLVLSAKRPVHYDIASEIEKVTLETDFIVSGDPIITNFANRLQVPELANLATVKYPPITSEDLVRLTEEYRAKAVVLTYDLPAHGEYVRYIQENYVFFKAYDKKGGISSIEGEIEPAKETFNVYLRPEHPVD